MRRFIFYFLTVVFFVGHSLQAQRKNQPKPRNVILMIGDGMGLAHIQAAMTVKGDRLHVERCLSIGFIKTHSSSHYVTDSAAGATAFSIGQKTYNGAIGIDSLGRPVPTILQIASQRGLSTGLVATSSITHATPAAFIAHQPSRRMEYEIATDFLKTNVDVFIGGGQKFFMKRPDGLNLTDSLRKRGYQVALSREEMIQSNPKAKLAALLYENAMPRYSQGRGDLLVEASLKAIDVLRQNRKGFFLMIEGSQIDWGGHNNDINYIVEEMIDFDHAIGAVLDFASQDGNTLVIITADHETGGLTLTDGSWQNKHIDAFFVTKEHTGIMVPVFAFGPGAELFQGIYDNTDIYHKIYQLLFK